MGKMEGLLYLLFVSICAIHCTKVEGEAPDFRPNTTSHNTRVPKVHRDCQAAYDDGWQHSGLYTISPYGSEQIDVFCEQTLDAGWVVIQKRINGQVNFFNTWNEYKNGFGNISGEFWIGNDMLHYLTSHDDKQLRIELGIGSETAVADYTHFMVDNEDLKYLLHVKGFTSSGNPGESMAWSNGQHFSTRDRDNDMSSGSCSKSHTGAWWYKRCGFANLNGALNAGGDDGAWWFSWKKFASMTSVQMMIKTR